MPKPIIEVRNLSKIFTLKHEDANAERYTALRDVITSKVKGVMRKRNNSHKKTEDFYALRDISFDIHQGDRVGIIGRNGAGKSTLLKVLSRITEPSSGSIRLRGRIASLLEVGTGFHPELTGRENIFLNGAILGMSRSEIRKKFDEIVDFAEIEKFLDTPVKRYSSGMYVRLAFAVAAHLEPEILVVDEVLAVGDVQFQKKCLGKMEDVSNNDGRTVLFVSHNIDAIERLCTKGLLLNSGQKQREGDIGEIISEYCSGSNSKEFEQIGLTDNCSLATFSFGNSSYTKGDRLQFSLCIRYPSQHKINLTDLCLIINDYKNVRVGIIDLRNDFNHLAFLDDHVTITGNIENFNLIEGEYFIGIYYGIDGVNREVLDLTSLSVRSAGGIINRYEHQYLGVVDINYKINS